MTCDYRDYTNYPHRVGDVYRLGESEDAWYYILAMVEGDPVNDDWLKYALISLNGGNRWVEPITLDRDSERPCDALSEEEFSALVGHEEREAFVKVPGKLYFSPLH
ncbi:hypothetical protein [Xanthomonas phage BUDD]|nr:hypothetical protein [Xanthomonas phage BUDD]